MLVALVLLLLVGIGNKYLQFIELLLASLATILGVNINNLI